MIPIPDDQAGPNPGPTLPDPATETPSSAGTFASAARQLLGELGLADPQTATAAADTSFTVARANGDPHLPGFELLGELGAGGMGVVYKARELALNRVVAIKMIRPDARPGTGDLVRFQAEAEAVAAVRHPNVVEVYSSGRAGDRPYYVMAYVGGGSLAARLAAGPLPPAEAAVVVAAVARGVHAAHTAGIVHRDLKPGNVLLEVGSGPLPVGRNGSEPGSSSPASDHRPLPTPKVSDFGLAKRLAAVGDGMTRTHAFLGTPAYMAPEQAQGRGKFVGPEADVYALGVVLYECLTGHPPFRDADPLALLRRVATEAPVPPRKLAPAVPRDLDLICLKCLAKEPRDRYATAADLADDLDRFSRGLPVAARPIPAPVRAARWVRRNPAPAALAALLLLLVALGPTAGVWYTGQMAVQDEARLRLEEKARQLEVARKAAVEVAAARELVAVQGVVHRREADRVAGWTWANRQDLRRAAGLAVGDAPALADLRTEAATALFAADLRPADPVARGFTAGTVAATQDGRIVALGESQGWGFEGAFGKLVSKVAPLRVRLVDAMTGENVQTFSLPGSPVEGDAAAPDRVVCLAFSPDGKRLFVGTRSRRVARFDVGASGGDAQKVWKAPAQPDHLVLTVDGAVVVGVCGKFLVRWDAATGTEGHKVEYDAPLGGLAVEPGRRTLVVAFPHGLVRGPADLRTLTPLPDAPAGPWVRHPVTFPGGRVLAAARNRTVELWDAATLRPVAGFTDPDLLHQAAHADDVTGLAVHPSGAYLASASADRVVKVWAVASGQRVASVQLGGTGPAALAWSGDGRFLLATGPGQTTRFEFAAPPAERFAGLHAEPLAAAVPDRDGRGVVVLGRGTPAAGPAGLLLARTGPDGRPVADRRLPVGPMASRPGLAVHPDTGVVAVTGADGGVVWWKASGDAPGPTLSPLPCRCPVYSPDGSVLWAVEDSNAVRAWDVKTGKRLGPGWDNVAGGIVIGLSALDALAVGRSSGVAGGADGGLHLLGPAAQYLDTVHGERDPVQAVALSPDEALAAAGTQTGRLRFVRVADRAELSGVADAHPGGVTGVSFSPDGAVLVTGGKDRAVRFWKQADGGRYEPVAAVTGLPAPVRSLTFARAGATLAVLLAGERAARVWDVDRLRGQLGELGLAW